jgi:multidrug efflux pump subunit AcrA (membrane-fusion protein)
MVKIRFIDRDPRTLPEMSAKVSFLSRPITKMDQRPRTAVSQKALVSRGDRKSVFRVQGDRAFQTSVIVGNPIGDLVEVIDGVKAGEQVVLDPPARMEPGLRRESRSNAECGIRNAE